MKRKIASIVCILLIFSIVFSACSVDKSKKASGNQTTSEYSGIVTEPGTFPIVKDKYTLKIFARQSPTIENIETNEFTVEYENKTNVHINWEFAPDNVIEEKRKLSLASGDYPDIYMGVKVTKAEEMSYGSRGVFIALNDLIDKHGVAIKKSFEKYPIIYDEIVAPDKKIYSLPDMGGALHTQYKQKLWLNTKWLKALNMTIPKTTDEFYNILKAFKEKDPNKNGKNDEIPFINERMEKEEQSFQKTSAQGFYNYFMNSFISYSTGRMIVKDGKLDIAYNKPEWRKGLEYLRKLYSEGLIDSTTFTITKQQVKQLAEKGNIEIIGSYVIQAPGQYFDYNGTRHKDFEAVPPLKGPDGVQTALWEPFNDIPGQFVITNKLKIPEVAIRWADYFFTVEGALRVKRGKEGVDWRRANPGELSYTDKPATWAKMTASQTVTNRYWSGINGPLNFTFHEDQFSSQNIFDPDGLETRLYQATKNSYEPYKTKNLIPPFYIPAEDLDKMDQKQMDITNYFTESMARFITGSWDLKGDWDKYVENLDKMGLKDVLAVYQKQYDSYLKNKK